MQTKDFITIGISIIAISISIIVFWLGYLKPGKLKISCGIPTLRIYPINDGSWNIASIHLPISYKNIGSKLLNISDIRICIDDANTEEPISTLYPKWLVDFKDFQSISGDRDLWLEKSINRNWYPIILTGKTDCHHETIFESRWDSIPHNILSFILEVNTDNNQKWKQVKSWRLNLEDKIAMGLVSGSSFSLLDISQRERRKSRSDETKEINKSTSTEGSNFFAVRCRDCGHTIGEISAMEGIQKLSCYSCGTETTVCIEKGGSIVTY